MSDIDPRDENEALSLRLAFDTDDPSFALGFEAGRLWQMLSDSDEAVTVIMHGPNAEMILRMAEATDRSVVSRELGHDWIESEFSSAGRGGTVTALPEHEWADHCIHCGVWRGAELAQARCQDLLDDDPDSKLARPPDADELVRWAEMYGHPEGWAKRAQQLHAENERLRQQLPELAGGSDRT